jgi:hypothetical protein
VSGNYTPLIAFATLRGVESRRVRLEGLLRLEYWLSIRMRAGDRGAKFEYLELKILLDKRKSA